MYDTSLIIRLIGFDETIRRYLETVSPLPNFKHYFVKASDLGAVQKNAVAVVIFSRKANATPEKIREFCGKNAICVYVMDKDEEELSDELLESLDHVWMYSQSEKMWQYSFKSLLRFIAEKRKKYFYSHALDTMVNMLPDLIWFKDIKGAHLKVNDAFCECVAKEKKDIEGRGHYYIWGLTEEMYNQGEFVCLETEEAVLERKCVCVFDEQVQDMVGNLRELKTWKAPIFDEDGKTVIGTVGVARDVTLENAQRHRIEELTF